jgi:hypothetical protein
VATTPRPRAVGIRGRGDFDRVGIAVDLDTGRCVIEVASLLMLACSFESVEDAAR